MLYALIFLTLPKACFSGLIFLIIILLYTEFVCFEKGKII